MTTYYVDDGGSNTNPYDSWANAAPTLQVLDTAKTLGAGDVVYIGHDSVDGSTGNITYQFSGSAPSAVIISATSGSSPVTYQAATTTSFGSTSGAITLRLAYTCYGLIIAATADINVDCDSDEVHRIEGCTFKPGGGFSVRPSTNFGHWQWKHVVIDLSADGTSTSSNPVIGNSSTPYFYNLRVSGLTFVNAAYRTGEIIKNADGVISGADFSGFTNATTCEIYTPGSSYRSSAGTTFSHCKTAATWTPMTSGRPTIGSDVQFLNCGSADAPTSLILRTWNGDLVSTTAIYRTGGAQIEGTATAWLVTTQSTCLQYNPFALPWMYGTVAAGSKTFTVYVTNDSGDLTDAEAWLEVEFLGESGSALWSLQDDSAGTPLATPVAQTDDTSSTWNGTGPSFTYKQALSVTTTVGQAGQYRARVVVGKASIASSAYFYVDPLVVVS